MPSVNDVLVALENGRWHDLQHLSKTAHIDDAKVTQVVQFLEEYRFIFVNAETKRISLSVDLRNLFQRLRQLE